MSTKLTEADSLIEEMLKEFRILKDQISNIYGQRLATLYVDFYIEYFINQIYNLKLEVFKQQGVEVDSIKYYSEDIKSNLSINAKATLLFTWGVIKDKKDLDSVIGIHRMRNKMAHNINPDIHEIKSRMDSLLSDESSAVDPDGVIIPYLRNTDFWEKFLNYSCAIVYNLYKYFYLMNNKNPKYQLHFKINSFDSKTIMSPIIINL